MPSSLKLTLYCILVGINRFIYSYNPNCQCVSDRAKKIVRCILFFANSIVVFLSYYYLILSRESVFVFVGEI